MLVWGACMYTYVPAQVHVYTRTCLRITATGTCISHYCNWHMYFALLQLAHVFRITATGIQKGHLGYSALGGLSNILHYQA